MILYHIISRRDPWWLSELYLPLSLSSLLMIYLSNTDNAETAGRRELMIVQPEIPFHCWLDLLLYNTSLDEWMYLRDTYLDVALQTQSITDILLSGWRKLCKLKFHHLFHSTVGMIKDKKVCFKKYFVAWLCSSFAEYESILKPCQSNYRLYWLL